jgi:hypothetical protein
LKGASHGTGRLLPFTGNYSPFADDRKKLIDLPENIKILEITIQTNTIYTKGIRKRKGE